MENSKTNVNITKYVVVNLARTKKAWSKIDELYYKNYNECSLLENDIEERMQLYGICLNKETIQHTCYINKIIALILLDEENGRPNNIIDIISSTFKKAYNYAVSNTVVKLSSYHFRKVNKKGSFEDIVTEHLCLIFVAFIYGKKVDTEDYFFKNLLSSLHYFDNIDDGMIKAEFSYKNCDKVRRNIINELELIVRGRYFPGGYKFDCFHELLRIRNCFEMEDSNTVGPSISKIKDDSLAKMLMAFEYTIDILDKTVSSALLGDIEIKKDTVKDFINIYLTFAGHDADSDEKIDKNDIDLDELSLFIIISLIQALYIESYINTYDFFFKNYDDKVKFKYMEVLNENMDMNNINSKLQNENQNLKSENEDLRRKIDKLEKELLKSKSNNRELFELRSYIFSNQEDETDIDEDCINLDHLKDKKIVCFGGNKAWISNMSKEFDNWTFIPADVINFDITILRGVDIVFIKATYISHAMYYRVIANLEDSTELKFINNNNIDRIKEELINTPIG